MVNEGPEEQTKSWRRFEGSSNMDVLNVLNAWNVLNAGSMHWQLEVRVSVTLGCLVQMRKAHYFGGKADCFGGKARTAAAAVQLATPKSLRWPIVGSLMN